MEGNEIHEYRFKNCTIKVNPHTVIPFSHRLVSSPREGTFQLRRPDLNEISVVSLSGYLRLSASPFSFI
jgi:hypothetical protein